MLLHWRVTRSDYWWEAVPDENWPDDEQSIAEIRSRFEGPHGDRRQELVFIGNSMNQQSIISILESCLLTDDEFESGPEAWAELPDPFPPIELSEDEPESGNM